MVTSGYQWLPVVLNGEIHDVTNNRSTKTQNTEVQTHSIHKGSSAKCLRNLLFCS